MEASWCYQTKSQEVCIFLSWVKSFDILTAKTLELIFLYLVLKNLQTPAKWLAGLVAVQLEVIFAFRSALSTAWIDEKHCQNQNLKQDHFYLVPLHLVLCNSFNWLLMPKSTQSKTLYWTRCTFIYENQNTVERATFWLWHIKLRGHKKGLIK